MLMSDSVDEFIREAYPDIKPSTKGSAVEATQGVEPSRQNEDIVGLIQNNRTRLNNII